MVSRRVELCTSDRKLQPLPTVFAEAAIICEKLRSQGKIEALGRLLFLPRGDGYSGIDAFLYLLCFFSICPHLGLRSLWGTWGTLASSLGPLLQRQALLSSSALSRLLQSLSPTFLLRVSFELLLHVSGIAPFLTDPAVLLASASGQLWHLFVFDPSRVAFQARSLPHGPDLPPPLSRTDDLAQPGYAGRKRGEHVTTFGFLEHLGAGAVLYLSTHPGNGDLRSMFLGAVQTVNRTLQAVDPQGKALLICDGEFGSVPYLDLVQREKVPYISRSSRYELLEVPEVRAVLKKATWREVEDSGAGPKRWAAELGVVRLPAGETTLRDDQSPYAPVEVRLVVSRYVASASDKGRGYRIGEERYELFVCSQVSSEEWPAESVVSLFYARCGQENRLGQYQKHLKFQKPHCYSPCGQLFVLVMAFFLSNFRLAAGLALKAPLEPPAPAAPKASSAAPPPLPFSPPVPEAKEAQGSPETVEVAPAAEAQGRPGAAEATQEASVASEAVPPEPMPPTPLEAKSEAALGAWCRLPWVTLLRRRVGWRWSREGWSLYNEREIELQFVSFERRGLKIDLRFSGESQEGKKEQASVSVPAAVAEEWLEKWLSYAEEQGRKKRGLVRARGRLHVEPGSWVVSYGGNRPLEEREIRWPELVPERARAGFAAEVFGSQIRVKTLAVLEAKAGHPYQEPSRARRQHRRKSITEQLARHRCQVPTEITFQLRSGLLEQWLRSDPAIPVQPG